MGTIDTCKECGKQLKKTKHERLSQKVCSDCRGEYMSVNKHARQIFKEMRDNPTEPSEDEKWFDDDPRALREEEYGRVSKNSSVVSSWGEIDYGRVVIQSTSNTSYGVSPLADMMSASDTNKYRHKHGSATEGTRFTYKKRR